MDHTDILNTGFTLCREMRQIERQWKEILPPLKEIESITNEAIKYKKADEELTRWNNEAKFLISKYEKTYENRT